MVVDRQDIEVRTSDGAFSAYFAAPEAPNGVVVVVLQEIFGVNPNIREIVDSFAETGYVAIAPDLYWRRQPGIQLDPLTEDGRAQAMELMKGLDRNQAVADGASALAAAKDRVPGLNRSAAVGYCFGGGVAYLMAVRGKVDVGVAYYGTGLQSLLDEAPDLKGKLLLHIAGEDHLCPPEAQAAIKAAVAALGDRAKVEVHPNAGHAFARKDGAAFNPAAATRANAMTMALLGSVIDRG